VRISNTLVNTYLMAGSFTFGGANSGSNLSDFILGDASNFVQGRGEYKNLESVLWSLYAQDNIRVTSKLKVEIGVRWNPYFPYTEEKGRIVCYIPGTTYPPGCPNGGSLTDALNFGPRLGFAYDLGHHAVLRGGGGIYYSPIGIPNPFPAQNALFTLPVSIYGTLQHDWHMPEVAT
jgi:outer membrane receptor protein involved in Fe transport